MDIHLDMITATEISTKQIIPEIDDYPSSYLQYGIVTIVYDTLEPGLDELWRFLGYEHITDKDKMVVEFKSSKNIYDPELVDIENTFHFANRFSSTAFPLYITHTKPDNILNTYFYTFPVKATFSFNKYHDKKLHSVFNKMAEYVHYESSSFNGTYTYTPKYSVGPRPTEQIAFGTLKLKPTKNTCRILFAYNPKILNEEESVYIMKKLIQNSYSK
jgi:hypothetical protein